MSIKKPFNQTRLDFQAGSSNPRKLLEGYLQTISAREAEVQAFTTLDEAGARNAADTSAKRYADGKSLSAIDGLPIALKDNLETRDLPTTFGSPIFENWRGGRDSAVAYALRRAGAVIVGKVVTTEFASTVVTTDTRNPHDIERTPGGSSSGSAAAVGAGMLPIAIGTQVIGSILRPASFCGVIGFKPSFGSINRAGNLDRYSQNCIGTLSVHMADAYAVCHEIAARVGGDAGFIPFQGGSIPAAKQRPEALAFLETAGWSLADERARSKLEALLDRFRSEGIEIRTRQNSKRVALLEDAIADAREVARKLCAFEALWPYSELSDREPVNFSKPMHERVTLGRSITTDHYAVLLRQRDEMRDVLVSLAGDVDGFITLSTIGPAPQGRTSAGNPIFNVPFTVLRVPVMSLPMLKLDGLPMGIQVAGFPNGERRLSSIAQYVLDYAEA